MNKQQSLNLGAIICLVVLSYVSYYLLVLDHTLPFSIGSVFLKVQHWSHPLRILVIGLLPVYIALVLFGTASAGIYTGSRLHRWAAGYLIDRSPYTTEKSSLKQGNLQKALNINRLNHSKRLSHFDGGFWL